MHRADGAHARIPHRARRADAVGSLTLNAVRPMFSRSTATVSPWFLSLYNCILRVQLLISVLDVLMQRSTYDERSIDELGLERRGALNALVIPSESRILFSVHIAQRVALSLTCHLSNRILRSFSSICKSKCGVFALIPRGRNTPVCCTQEMLCPRL